MTALLESLRQTGRDLIQKRLWPVAVVLLVALIAAPMMIGRSSGDAVAPDPVAAAPGAAGAAPSATPATAEATTTKTKPVKAKLTGKVDDPFFDPPSSPDAGAGAGGGGGSARAVAKSPTGEAAPRGGGGSAAKSEAKASPGASQAGPQATTPATPSPRVTPTPAAAPLTSSYLRTIVRVDGAERGKPFPVSRLTPLGGATDPGVVFLGVAKAGARYAVFVLGPHASSEGQATCKGDTDCRMIGLRAGQSQVVTVRRPSGAVRRFTLRVAAIRTVTTSAARARAARARIHPDGYDVLRELRRHAPSAATLRTARYDAKAGLLRSASAAATNASK